MLFSFLSLIFKSNQDESVRLWNVHTGICILILAGAGGHRNEVLSVVSEILLLTGKAETLPYFLTTLFDDCTRKGILHVCCTDVVWQL